ncbi:MAG: HAD hydrolase family protein [Eubacteriales bacterium]|jgi:Cof subfamily protein (haloacid dehalogenase superfamily)
MNRFQDWLLVSDMDRSLLDDNKEIPPRNLEALQYFLSEGGHFTVATGRTPTSIARYLDILPLNAPVICNNGSGLYDFQRQRYTWHLSLDVTAVQTVVDDVMQRFPHIGVEVYEPERICIPVRNIHTDRHMELESMGFTEGTYKHPPYTWLKVVFTQDHSQLEVLRRHVEAMGYAEQFPSIRFVYSEPQYFELLSVEGNKGTGLTMLAKQLGIRPDHTAALGDNYNDLELIQAAGRGYTVANAVPELRAISCQTVCDNNAGGLADVIQLLEQETTS